MNAIRYNDDRKRRLMSLDQEVIVDGLLMFAMRHPDVDGWVERMTDSPEGNVATFYDELESLKHGQRFVSWSQSHGYALELIDLLETLAAGETDPMRGLEAVMAFFRSDAAIMECVDDSNGEVGGVFSEEAVDLFVRYARDCSDHAWVSQCWMDLLETDAYGVREGLIGAAHRFLSREHLMALAASCQEKAGSESVGTFRSHWLSLVASVAQQLKDPVLFESARSARVDGGSDSALLEIAREYQANGQAHEALERLNRISVDIGFRSFERDRLLLQVLIDLQDQAAAKGLALDLFQRYPSSESLKTLIGIVGEDHRGPVIQDEIDRRGQETQLSLPFVVLLMEEGRSDAASLYIQARSEQIKGEYYGSLSSLAVSLTSNGHVLTASLVYRALLDSILERAQSKAYPYGVGYLIELDRLEAQIYDWGRFGTHREYFSRLKSLYARRPAFWSKYKG